MASARRLLSPLQRSFINPIVRAAWALGLGPPGDALLETTGRRTGQLRLTPICDCLDGDTFWVVSQRGRRADYIRNITSNPRVRVKVRSGLRTRWLTGTAHILDDDDPKTRLQLLLGSSVARALCLRAASAIVSDPDATQVTVRVDLDSR
jgi:deazaflavin-dependent oxidoreductase (nitroreductase family)